MRANNVDTCDFFGDGVFHLNAGVHLDEVELARIHIHQEFDGACAFVVHVFADFLAQITEAFTLRGRQIWGRGAFDDLLVAALYRTVAFPEVINVTLFIAEDLHLDVAGTQNHLFQIAFAIAKGGFGFTATFADFFLELCFVHDRAHAATAATPRCLEHPRVANFGGLHTDNIHVFAQNFGCWNDRNARLHRDLTRAGLIAKFAHGFRFGANKGDAVAITRINEIGVFRQKAVAGVDGVRAGHFGDADHLINREVGGNWAQSLANAVGFVSLKTVKAEFVFFGVDRNGLFPHLVRGPHNADRDFTTVGDQNLFELGHSRALLCRCSKGVERFCGCVNSFFDDMLAITYLLR